MGEILFIDDDTDALEMYSKAVSLADHQAYLAVDAREARRIISKHNLDIIFVDINLPGTSGLQLLREFAELEATRDVPVILLSAVPEVDLDEEGLRGARLFLEKPVSLQRLLSVIGQYASAPQEPL